MCGISITDPGASRCAIANRHDAQYALVSHAGFSMIRINDESQWWWGDSLFKWFLIYLTSIDRHDESLTKISVIIMSLKLNHYLTII